MTGKADGTPAAGRAEPATPPRQDGHADDVIRNAKAVLERDPTQAEAWRTLLSLPLHEHPDALGIRAWTPLTRSRAPEIIAELLQTTQERFDAGRLVVAFELARLCGLRLPHGRLAESAGVPVLARPIRIPPQDFPDEDVVRILDHDYQSWVHTHNRPDDNRKAQHPFAPFVRIPGLQVERTRSPDKPECAFTLFDADHALVLQDTMWSGLVATPKLVICPTLRTAVTLGWTPGPTVASPVVFLPNRENYYHFLMETLPAAVIAARHPALADKPLLFSRLSPWQREALSMAGIAPERTQELENLLPSRPETDHLRFETAWIPVELPFALACAVVRDALPAKREMRRGARYFIARGGGGAHVVRRLENEDAVAAALATRGFIPVVAEKLSFAEQVELFSHAEMIAGPHGAGLTNIVHAPQQATLIELMNASCHNERKMNFSSMQRIAQCDGQSYIRVVGAEQPGIGAEVFPPNRPYTVNIPDLLRAVDAAAQPYAHTVYVS